MENKPIICVLVDGRYVELTDKPLALIMRDGHWSRLTVRDRLNRLAEDIVNAILDFLAGIQDRVNR